MHSTALWVLGPGEVWLAVEVYQRPSTASRPSCLVTVNTPSTVWFLQWPLSSPLGFLSTVRIESSSRWRQALSPLLTAHPTGQGRDLVEGHSQGGEFTFRPGVIGFVPSQNSLLLVLFLQAKSPRGLALRTVLSQSPLPVATWGRATDLPAPLSGKHRFVHILHPPPPFRAAERLQFACPGDFLLKF